ncbi:putative RING finger and WD repeat-containing protein [Venturia nashicola]|uniref:Putative RING finger and WD repeat-containing protein n=1 Tax=Venturia nashicola TaxID=86259 RepID=A0A4Z1P557_9PEZI|nr:putative RING finger and WD repeat-containing protein [Venturia nashicola]TLD23516.1 putative RING finger and WD repeat-containing protein [Venturia nashicola]
MRFSILTVVASIASMVSAQAGAAEPPKCGTTVMISAISSSGCEVQCMCKNTNLIKTVQAKIPKVCAAEADRAVFAMFFNSQCVGQPGFPITIGGGEKSATTTSGGAKAASATGKSDARTTRVSVGVLAIAGAVAVALS